jgi:hypothetical protein
LDYAEITNLASVVLERKGKVAFVEEHTCVRKSAVGCGLLKEFPFHVPSLQVNDGRFVK